MMAAAGGIVLGFETMETEFMNTTEKAMKYVNLIDNPYLGVYPDSGNLTNAALTYESDVCQDLRMGAGHLAAFSGIQLHIVYHGTYRNLGQRQAVAHSHFGFRTVHDFHAVSEALGSEDIGFLAVLNKQNQRE